MVAMAPRRGRFRGATSPGGRGEPAPSAGLPSHCGACLAKRDYYEILGAGRDVDADSLKKAYRNVAMRDHPDRNPDDPAAEDRFKEASEAYAVLSDPDKRAAYDRFGHGGVSGGAPGGVPPVLVKAGVPTHLPAKNACRARIRFPAG